MADLLSSWRAWEDTGPPYVLPDDGAVLESPRSQRAIAPSWQTWQQVHSQPDCGQPQDTRLHLGLVPHPFCGDLTHAEIYLLMLNPGYGPHDYYAELEAPAYREAALQNLRQDFAPDDYPFYLLDPRFAWSGGYNWWHGKFARTIQAVAERRALSYADARHEVSRKIASIELLPYHSTSFKDAGNWRRDLTSAQLVRDYITDYVLPKAQRDEAVIIVTRQVREWALPLHPNVVVYSGGQARGASLGPETAGGQAILNRLLRG